MQSEASATQLLDSACQALLRDIDDFRTRNKNPNLAQLGRTATWLRNQINKNLIASDESFSKKADLLHKYTEMWMICWVSWHQLLETPKKVASGQSLIRSVQAAQNLVQGLYRIIYEQHLDLELKRQMLVVVPFGSDLYATGAELPTPFIVGPYWGHNQVWTWLSYAHEVGHHVYRNVKGLREELKVNLVMELWSCGQSYADQRIWFYWLEEIFADLFGLLRIGPAFARSQYLMILHLPDPVTQRGASSRVLAAADERHPIPYLRAYFALRALEKVRPGADQSSTKASAGVGWTNPSDKIKQDPDLLELWKKWTSLLAEEPSKSRVGGQTEPQPSHLFALVKGQSMNRSAQELQDTADVVLDVLLDTELYALAKTSSPKEPRSIRTVFFEPKQSKNEKLLANTQQNLENLLRQPQVSLDDVESLNQQLISALSPDSGGVSGRA